jgi:transcriptional regulator with XRE-family HTH domain
MGRPKNLTLQGIDSRLRAIRKERKLTAPQMAAELEIGSNSYNKYERGLYFPSLKNLAMLSEKFDISMDWLIYDKVAMHFSTIQKALQENEQLKQGREEAYVPAKGPDAAIVTDPEIKELIRYKEDNPMFKHQLLIYFYRHKKGGQKTEDAETSPFE